MEKTMAFNLICNGNPVYTIEDLRENFSEQDVLCYFNNKLLHKWLNACGYDKEFEAVSKIADNEPNQIIKELTKIISGESEENGTEVNADRAIGDYFEKYERLIDGIIASPDDTALIKASVAEIADKYFRVFEYDHRKLFYKLIRSAPLAVLFLLANEKTRYYYLPKDGENLNVYSSIELKNFKFEVSLKEMMYKEICNTFTSIRLPEILKGNLCSFPGTTGGKWINLKPKGKKYMILNMNANGHVRSQGDSGDSQGDSRDALSVLGPIQTAILGLLDSKYRFKILDGIDYMTDASNTGALLYMEV